MWQPLQYLGTWGSSKRGEWSPLHVLNTSHYRGSWVNVLDLVVQGIFLNCAILKTDAYICLWLNGLKQITSPLPASTSIPGNKQCFWGDLKPESMNLECRTQGGRPQPGSRPVVHSLPSAQALQYSFSFCGNPQPWNYFQCYFITY